MPDQPASPRVPDDTDRKLPEWLAVAPEIDPLVEGIVDRVHLVSRYLEAVAAKMAAPRGIGPGEYEILARLYWVGPPHRLTPTQLAAGTVTAATTITSRLDRLEKAELVERRPDPNNRRSLHVLLTDKGAGTFLEIVAEQAVAEKELFATLDRDEQAQLEDMMRRLMHHMAEKLGPAPRRVRLALTGGGPAGEGGTGQNAAR